MTLPNRVERQPTLTIRNTLNDFDHVPSEIVAQGSDDRHPLVSIVIPTFRRLGFLVEAVASALAQNFDRPYEIVVIDNDPESKDAERLIERFPELKERNFRYFVNRENIGMFPNWNRCILLARGEWMSMLNDDDLLDADYLATIFSVLDREPSIDGLATQKRLLDQRPGVKPWTPSLPRRIAKRVLLESLFTGQRTRRISARKMFWSPIMGNIVGLTFKTRVGKELGGFYPEDYPSDTWFYARFAAYYDLRQHRAVAASIRVAENESANLNTIKGFMEDGQQFRHELVKGQAPRWWKHLSPHLSARHRTMLQEFWRVEMATPELEERLRIRLPADRPRLYKAMRIIFRGF